MSKVATRSPGEQVAALMAQPPHVRLEAVRRLGAPLIRQVAEVTGTPWFLWSDDPVGFTRVILGEQIWQAQTDILHSVWDHQRTAVAACHGPGKTHLAARIAAWWISCHPVGTAQVVTTAPTYRQVEQLLWPHIRRLRDQYGLPGDIGLAPKWRIDDDVLAFGFSPRDSDESAAQGIHADFILVIIDEAGGISRTRGQSMEGMMATGVARMLAIGNPATDDESSWFEEVYTASGWNSIRIPVWDTPNFTGELTGPCRCVRSKFTPHMIAEHLVTPEWVAGIEEDYGRGSAYWTARVDAEFPHGMTDKVIPLSWIENAERLLKPGRLSNRVTGGVDVAADGGDELTLAINAAGTVTVPLHIAGPQLADQHWAALQVLNHIIGTDVDHEGMIAMAKRIDANQRITIRVDSLGIGLGVFTILKAWCAERQLPVDVVEVRVSQSPTRSSGATKYLNQRAEMWWTLREAIKALDVKLVIDQRTRAQLNGPTYTSTSRGLRQIEKKSDMKARGVPSPDRAEAIGLALFDAIEPVLPKTGSSTLARRRVPTKAPHRRPGFR